MDLPRWLLEHGEDAQFALFFGALALFALLEAVLPRRRQPRKRGERWPTNAALFSHANLRLPVAWDRVLRDVIVTPDLHRVHHSTRPCETDSNFGAVFPIWDLVLGTFCGAPQDGHDQMKLGLAELRGAEAQRLVPLLLSPLRRDLGPAPSTQPARSSTA